MKAYQLMTMAAVLALLGSCAKEPVLELEVADPDLIPISIEGSIDQVATKATAAGFVDKDAVGLFAVNYTEENTVAGTLAAEGNQADNVKYVFDEAAYKWTPMRPVYYKDINTNVDLYVYYPYQSAIADVNAYNFEVRKDQSTAASGSGMSGYEASDWLWGVATGITPSESRVRIPLNHRLSAVQVTLLEGTGFEEGEFASLSRSVILTNTTRKATLDFSTGTATPLGAPQADGIVMCPQEDGSFLAIVIPQTVEGGTPLFAITLDGISYSFKQSDEVTYQAGKQLSVSITLKKKTPTGEYELTLADAQIVDWTEDRNSHGGEARQYFVVNVETPGTLGEVISSMGKNPDKIRNLKVTGTVNEDDFSFMCDNMAILEAVNMKECEPRVKIDFEAKFPSSLYDYYLTLFGEPTLINWDGSYGWSVPDIKGIPYSAFSKKKTLTKFVFPEDLFAIGTDAFTGSNVSGALIIPDGVIVIGTNAFSYTQIGSIQFPSSLFKIGDGAFSHCSSLSGELCFPSGVLYIGNNAFDQCHGLGGRLNLPHDLEYLGAYAFQSCSTFIGDLVIPEKIKVLMDDTFWGTSFTGSLDLSNVQEIRGSCFSNCGFSGTLVIPEGVVEVGGFDGNKFSYIVFPSTLRTIGRMSTGPMTEPLIIPEGVVTISTWAFAESGITSVHLPSTLQTLQDGVFSNCYFLSSIICDAIEPPTVMSDNTFQGVAKDNFTVEVPAQSVKRYQAESGWSDFKRIAAHYDFSLSRERMRTLGGEKTRIFTLRAPANYSWSIREKPDWVTVEPASGIGKTDITVTVAEMTAADVSTFEVNEGSFNYPDYHNYSGRSGELILQLEEKDYTCSLTIEQYDSPYPDGEVQTLQMASAGAGIDIVLTGDGYDARDIAKGTFRTNAEDAYGHLFDVEPYKTYKEYFNVYAVTALSDESGIGTLNTIIDNKFGSTFTQNRILLENQDAVFAWAKKADAGMDLTKSLVILLQYTSTYEGVTYLYGDGSALACCPVSTQAYPYDFRGIIQHEAGGHGFGKLADEYIYHNAFIQNCTCMDGCDHGQVFNGMKSLGWYANLSMTSDATQVPWAHLIYHPQYSDYVDMYEGGYMHSRGVYRSEATSCMNNNIPYFSAISRQAIVERIMDYAGESFSLEDFYAKDDDSFGPTTKAGIRHATDRTYGVDPKFHLGTDECVIFVGDHPNVK